MVRAIMTDIDDPNTRPQIRIQKGRSRRLRSGHPWLFSNELEMTAEAKALPRGTLVTVVDAGDERLGVATFNPHSLIAARLLSSNWQDAVTADFLARRLGRAKTLRDRLFPEPWYRLAYSEADGLPGLVVDRYGPVVTVQVNTAGMELLTPLVIEALVKVLSPDAIVLKNDSPVRTLEGLELYDRIALGAVDGPVQVRENGLTYFADLVQGQKTGWFFDQRDNRAFLGRLSHGKPVLDVFSYGGGFALAMLAGGATSAIAVDRSAEALDLAEKAAAANNFTLQTARAEAFAEMERLAQAKETFGVVAVDPPAFVKSRKDLAVGSKGYRKMARLAAPLVEPSGILFCASCSHHMPEGQFLDEIAHGLSLAGRTGRILRVSGAGPDHPLHPHVPESAYLKAVTLQLD